MRYDIKIPPTADGALEVTVVSWIKQVGDPVSKGQDLAEATTEKITLYVTAPAAGSVPETPTVVSVPATLPLHAASARAPV